jgi:outer membrane beta-barrel protein
MKIALGWIISLVFASTSFAAVSAASDPEKEYEHSINAIVRQKIYYKAGRIEVGGAVGAMPYDSVINHFMAGGRLTWHFADHYGWEVLDAMLTFPTVSSFTTNLVQTQGITNLQTVKLKMLFGTNFVMSPLYGKIRFFGRQVLHLDLYFVAGLGAASTETLKFVSTGTSSAPTQSTAKTGFDPMFDFGLGFRVFLNSAMALNFDFRDYVVYSQVYSGRSLKSNFAVFGGLSFFLPTF